MKYILEKDCIKIYDKEDFNPEHILECGQVFCYDKIGDEYIVYPQDKVARIKEFDDYYLIKTKNPSFFEFFFDLNNDYGEIKQELNKHEVMQKPIKFGHGIRILNQNLFEMTISFIISSNNNIKRIKLILNNLRKNLGNLIEKEIYSFPSFKKLYSCDEEFFKKMGAGYRANYLYKILRQIDNNIFERMKNLPTNELRNELIKLSGIGPKVADCILLFGFHRGDVFPVDTWIEKVYKTYFSDISDRNKIRQNLIDEFGDLSGYAQQYLFYYQRSFVKN